MAVEIYNGQFVTDTLGPAAALRMEGELGTPRTLAVRYTAPRPWLLDRTVLRITTSTLSFGVAVDDVLANGVVYVEPAQLCVRTESAPLQETLQRVIAAPTVLEQVRKMPDQSFAQAVAVNYLPVQNRCPTMLSLVADNRKVMVQRSGEIGFGPTYLDFVQQRSRHRLVPTFGSGTQHAFPDTGIAEHPGYSRRLEGGWLPMPHIRVADNGLVYHQIACVAPWDKPGTVAPSPYLHPTPLCVAQYVIENPGKTPLSATLTLGAVADAEKKRPAAFEASEKHWLMRGGDTLLGVVERPPAPLACEAQGDLLRISGECPPETSLTFYAYMPMQWSLAPGEIAALGSGPSCAASPSNTGTRFWRRPCRSRCLTSCWPTCYARRRCIARWRHATKQMARASMRGSLRRTMRPWTRKAMPSCTAWISGANTTSPAARWPIFWNGINRQGTCRTVTRWSARASTCGGRPTTTGSRAMMPGGATSRRS